MKAKDYIIIGSAVALFLLWKNKNKKVGTSTGTTTTGDATAETTTGGGTATGGATAGTSQVTTFPTPTSSEPEQVFGLGLPSGMDLPILTAGTGIPTEVAVQQGGVVTTPEPAIVHAPPLGIEEALNLGGIKPIVKSDIKPLPILVSTDPIVVVPREKPTLYLSDVM